MAIKKKKSMWTLRDLLLLKLKALYDVESELVKALPKVAEAASDADLRQTIGDHLEETKLHVKRIESSFAILGESVEKIGVDAIRGLISDTEWVIKNVQGSTSLDCVLIASAQYVEHYEMAGYRSAQKWAEVLGEDEIAALLGDTLKEEIDGDNKLDKLASVLNERIDVNKESE